MPDVDDLRDSSFVGQESDFVFLLWRMREKDKKAPGGYKMTDTARLRVGKNRWNGKLGVLDMAYRDNKFYELTNRYNADEDAT